MNKAYPIKDFPDYYITNTGNVYSRKIKGRFKKKTLLYNKDGYLTVGIIHKTGKQKSVLVHRLVAETFIPNPDNKPCVNHKNGIKTDNNIKNLEWMTVSENTKHAYRVLGVPPNKTNLGKKGMLCAYAKKIAQIKDNKIIAEFYGGEEAERITGLNKNSIRRCCRGERKTYKGYYWIYK